MSRRTSWLAATVLMLSAGRAEAVGCSLSNPEVGTLSLERGSTVKAYRGKDAVPILLGDGAILCLGDRLLASASSGAVKLTTGEPRPFAAGTVPDVPSSRNTILDWVFGNPRRWLSRPSQLGGRVLGGGGDGEIMLPGLIDGKATLSTRFSTLTLPITPADSVRTFQLFPPGARAPVESAVARAGDAIIVFRRLRPQAGLWRILILETNQLRGFTMARDQATIVNSDSRSASLSAADRVLLEACKDPVSNSLNAYQSLVGIRSSDQEKAILLSWQYPTDQLSCATPAGVVDSAPRRE